MKYTPIPGYAGKYLISTDGTVCNSDGHVIKPISSKDGLRVELRLLGQRDRPLIADLISTVYGGRTDDI